MVLSWERYEVVPVSPLPAHLKTILNGDSGGCFGIFLMQVGVPSACSVASARCGFTLLTDRYLDKLLAETQVLENVPRGDRPKGVLPKCEVLIRHFIPGISNAEMAAALRQRHEPPQSRDSPLLHANNLEHCDGTMGSGDAKDAKQFVQAIKQPESSAQKAVIDFVQAKGYITAEQALHEQVELGLKPKAAPPSSERSAPAKEVWSWQESFLKQACPLSRGRPSKMYRTSTRPVGPPTTQAGAKEPHLQVWAKRHLERRRRQGRILLDVAPAQGFDRRADTGQSRGAFGAKPPIAKGACRRKRRIIYFVVDYV